MVQRVIGAEQHMNTNLLTGSFVGGGNKREKGKVIQIKVWEQVYSHRKDFISERLCPLLYTVIKFLCFYSNFKARSRKMLDPSNSFLDRILQPPCILQTNNEDCIVWCPLIHQKKALGLHTLLSTLLKKIQQFWDCSAFHPSAYC